MPLTLRDRHFLHAVQRFKIYSFCIALGIFIYLLLLPPSDIQIPTSILAVTLCGVFLLTQRLLSLITLLDFELTRTINALRQSLPRSEQGKGSFR